MAGGGAPVVNSASIATAYVGVAFEYDITAANTPISYDWSGVVGGLSVNTGNGHITGTPTTKGITYTYVTATNGKGAGTKQLVFAVLNVGDPIPNRPIYYIDNPTHDGTLATAWSTTSGGSNDVTALATTDILYFDHALTCNNVPTCNGVVLSAGTINRATAWNVGGVYPSGTGALFTGWQQSGGVFNGSTTGLLTINGSPLNVTAGTLNGGVRFNVEFYAGNNYSSVVMAAGCWTTGVNPFYIYVGPNTSYTTGYLSAGSCNMNFYGNTVYDFEICSDTNHSPPSVIHRGTIVISGSYIHCFTGTTADNGVTSVTGTLTQDASSDIYIGTISSYFGCTGNKGLIHPVNINQMQWAGGRIITWEQNAVFLLTSTATGYISSTGTPSNPTFIRTSVLGGVAYWKMIAGGTSQIVGNASFLDIDASNGITFVAGVGPYSNTYNCTHFSGTAAGRVFTNLPSQVGTKGTPFSFTPTTVANIPDPVLSYGISPALTDNLSLDTSTGIISGTPGAALSKTRYIMSATNRVQAGYGPVDITISAPTSKNYPPPMACLIGS